jgi:hypothetical protein
MNGLLVRVGIDSTDGDWNAPVCISEKPLATANQTILQRVFLSL